MTGSGVPIFKDREWRMGLALYGENFFLCCLSLNFSHSYLSISGRLGSPIKIRKIYEDH